MNLMYLECTYKHSNWFHPNNKEVVTVVMLENQEDFLMHQQSKFIYSKIKTVFIILEDFCILKLFKAYKTLKKTYPKLWWIQESHVNMFLNHIMNK